ncbi:hypothetical protein MJM83_29320, partial [Salmonella enterica subsp. enterica serovar Montevideo]|nr:hypothetical protein [Salmonella enterica subsp. enterica serovar Montevideo]
VVYAWILRLPSQPLPIIGSGKIERVRAALEAETLSLSRQQWFPIDLNANFSHAYIFNRNHKVFSHYGTINSPRNLLIFKEKYNNH